MRGWYVTWMEGSILRARYELRVLSAMGTLATYPREQSKLPCGATDGMFDFEIKLPST